MTAKQDISLFLSRTDNIQSHPVMTGMKPGLIPHAKIPVLKIVSNSESRLTNYAKKPEEKISADC